jgi:hypothetical protein
MPQILAFIRRKSPNAETTAALDKVWCRCCVRPTAGAPPR